MSNPFAVTRDGLNSEFGVIVKYINTHKIRLHVSIADLNKLNDLYGTLSSEETYLYYYNKWSDIAGSRTKGVRDNLTDMEKKIKKLLVKIYSDIPASIWTTTDRNTFNRKKGKKRKITRKNTPIKAKTFMRFKLIGSGEVMFSTYTEKESPRPCINRDAGANSVEIAMCIVAPENALIHFEKIGLVKKEKVSSPDECLFREIHHKAMFLLQFPVEYRKCDVHIYARQYDDKHPKLAGPWSVALIITIP
jgi:hypothetical protein